jgi:hypothetical protein
VLPCTMHGATVLIPFMMQVSLHYLLRSLAETNSMTQKRNSKEEQEVKSIGNALDSMFIAT